MMVNYVSICLIENWTKNGDFAFPSFPSSLSTCCICGTADMGTRCGDAICGEPGASGITGGT